MLVLPVKSNFCRKKSAVKFLCVKTSSGKAVATSFLYLTVHGRIAGDVPIYLKFALKMTHPFRKRRFRQISLNCASAVRASKKVQLSLIGSRQCVSHQAIDEPRALLPQKVVQNENFYPRGASDARVIAIIACMSVSLCVCVSHAGIVSKRLNVGSRKQHHVIAQGP